MEFIRYHTASGHIQDAFISTQASLEMTEAMAPIVGTSTIQGKRDIVQSHYVIDSEACLRAPLDGLAVPGIVQQSATAQTIISGLPDPCWLRIRGKWANQVDVAPRLIEGGLFSFVPEMVGTYFVEILGKHVCPDITFEVVTLDGLKVRRTEEVNAARSLIMANGFIWNGHRYDCDEKAQANVTSVAGLLNSGIAIPDNFAWRTFDNQNVAIDAEGVKALGAAMFAFSNSVFQKAISLKDAIASALNIESILNINLEADWPNK